MIKIRTDDRLKLRKLFITRKETKTVELKTKYLLGKLLTPMILNHFLLLIEHDKLLFKNS